ncbi:MAG: phosphohydrolase [Sphingobacteriales bacterium SCN 48-20]|uniref:Pycsar system effector family protein n=1 Tax=Terrimonas ferruginea TaxID=249 RepID=UPI00086A09DB|nr:Pycsar system effector family protein [Terrimonas ferruginea]MBN8782715.1 HD domain-containing protein [Terrimonas ferruginea]ODT92891.1 MAG: phosphohydrolase [Sphingobacteriales bacterium SCN 48-20]OJW43920.1 MAG: phosphohydrolase [Sphingobacteriales bacterium 48-107]
MNYVQLLEDVKNEMIRFFHTHENPELVYHNLSHTQAVVASAAQIARHYKLDDRDFFVVCAAAWFHDAGYYISGATEHERRGAELATAFLQQQAVDEFVISDVRNCIMATCMPQHPATLLEKIVADADLYHLGTDRFIELNKKMRKEAEWRKGEKIGKSEWRQGTLKLLESHLYHTDYVRDLLEQGKRANIQLLKEKESDTPAPLMITTEQGPVPETPVVKKVKIERPERGIETMFRISSNNHQRLSDMADNKANIMITTTSIILSVLLSVLLRKLEDNPHLIIPTVLLLTVCVTTLVFSILATRPALPEGRFTPQDISDKKVNLLFFGNFFRMSYEEYNKGMQQMMNDRDFLYGSLTRDVYSQGVVLGRKYRLLRKGYNVFMFGIIISVLAFMIAVVFFS